MVHAGQAVRLNAPNGPERLAPLDIIDRRANPHGKNLGNRQRVLARARAAVSRAARDLVESGKLREIGKHGEVAIPSGSLHEPSFHTVFSGGERRAVLPGNREFSAGDRLKRPPGGGRSGGGAGEGSGGGGDQEDAFRFVLTRDEFLDVFFEDLELPDMVKSQVLAATTTSQVRAGISRDGGPSQIDLSRTMRQSMARRIGLGRPKPASVEALEAEIAELEADGDRHGRLPELRVTLAEARARSARIPWIDPVDLRYRRFTKVSKPCAQAVMFCLMDVSGSMTEPMKEVAKSFFLLLHVFLERRYKRVDLVFIRHTETAEEVSEDVFFTDPRTGGTVVSTALAEFTRIQRARYKESDWNIYAAQASDGDNASGDTARAVAMMETDILPIAQYVAYIEIAGFGGMIRGETDLWRGYAGLADRVDNLAMRRVAERRDIFPVFRELFRRRQAGARP